MESLANKNRPHNFKDVVGQEIVIKILERQLELNKISNCYLLNGPTGVGKTTIGRILAYLVNDGEGEPFEIDAASNNGVDSVMSIISSARERSFSGKYKVYIIDECQMLTIQAWNKFLKCLEEPPKYTIFIFCTTDPQKIPSTVLNRMLRLNLTKLDSTSIEERLAKICKDEGFKNFQESCKYISKICDGGMRDAIALLEKCSMYSDDLCIENVLKVLGSFSYKTYFNLINAITEGNEASIIDIIEYIHSSGKDLSLFISLFLDFIVELSNYCIFKDINLISIPNNMEFAVSADDTTNIEYAINIGVANKVVFFNKVADKILEIKRAIKNDTYIKDTIIVMLARLCRGTAV